MKTIKSIEELQKEKIRLQKELSEINRAISHHDEMRLEQQYGDEFHCEFCRYNAVSSCDGDHNVCGKGNCTCCHNRCEDYKPDNEATKFIKTQAVFGEGLFRNKKTNGYKHIDDREYKALISLGADIFADEPDEYSIQLLKMFVTQLKAYYDKIRKYKN